MYVHTYIHENKDNQSVTFCHLYRAYKVSKQNHPTYLEPTQAHSLILLFTQLPISPPTIYNIHESSKPIHRHIFEGMNLTLTHTSSFSQ